MSRMASDGSVRVTVVDGTSVTGVQAPDGSINVIQATGAHLGLYHPCGAIQVTVIDQADEPQGFYAIDGSMNVCESKALKATGAIFVTAVSGVLVSSPLDEFLLEDGTYLLLETNEALLLE